MICWEWEQDNFKGVPTKKNHNKKTKNTHRDEPTHEIKREGGDVIFHSEIDWWYWLQKHQINTSFPLNCASDLFDLTGLKSDLWFHLLKDVWPLPVTRFSRMEYSGGILMNTPNGRLQVTQGKELY